MPHYLERVVSFTYVCYRIRSIGESERRMDGCFNWIRPDARLAVVIQMQAYVFTTLWKHRSVVSGVLAGWMPRVLRVRLPRSTFSNSWPARQMFIWLGEGMRFPDLTALRNPLPDGVLHIYIQICLSLHRLAAVFL